MIHFYDADFYDVFSQGRESFKTDIVKYISTVINLYKNSCHIKYLLPISL